MQHHLFSLEFLSPLSSSLGGRIFVESNQHCSVVQQTFFFSNRYLQANSSSTSHNPRPHPHKHKGTSHHTLLLLLGPQRTFPLLCDIAPGSSTAALLSCQLAWVLSWGRFEGWRRRAGLPFSGLSAVPQWRFPLSSSWLQPPFPLSASVIAPPKQIRSSQAVCPSQRSEPRLHRVMY